MPRVSILLTSYNHIAYLPAALESIRSQTFDNYEVIALDDGSTDGSRELLTNYVETLHQDERKRYSLVFHEENKGTYGSLNVGLSKATGELIAILNDDDCWAPTKLERQIQLLDKHPDVGLVHTDGWFIGPEGERLSGTPPGFAYPRFETGDLLITLLYANKIIASAALVRKECFDKCGTFDERLFGLGDWSMWLRVAEYYKVGFVDEPLTFYRWHSDNASRSVESMCQDDLFLKTQIVANQERYWQRGCDKRELSRALAHNWACLGTLRKFHGDSSGARAAFLESLKITPLRAKSVVRYLATFLPEQLFRRL